MLSINNKIMIFLHQIPVQFWNPHNVHNVTVIPKDLSLPFANKTENANVKRSITELSAITETVK